MRFGREFETLEVWGEPVSRSHVVVYQLGIRLPGGLATFGVLQEDAPLRSALLKKNIVLLTCWPSDLLASKAKRTIRARQVS